MFPDQESNWRPTTLQHVAQPTEHTGQGVSVSVSLPDVLMPPGRL